MIQYFYRTIDIKEFKSFNNDLGNLYPKIIESMLSKVTKITIDGTKVSLILAIIATIIIVLIQTIPTINNYIKDFFPDGNNTILSVFGVLATLSGTFLAIQSVKQSKSIQHISYEIADATRNPIEGIDEVLVRIEKLLEKRTSNSKFWYLGLTLGIGPIHNIDSIIKKWKKKRKQLYPKSIHIDFSTMCKSLNKKLNSILTEDKKLTENTKQHIVCLNEAGRASFVNKLYNTKDYTKHIKKGKMNENVTLANSYHSHLWNAIENNTNVKKKEIGTLPIQVLICEINDDYEFKKAMIVFTVGTENVGSKVLGFYSESPSTCSLFAEYVESLCN